MKYVSLPDERERHLSFFLAMEEYVARQCQERDLFFLWQVRPSVIFGRNQSVEQEVNEAYCRANGIEMYRRKSGGGCVYADWGNIMLSYISGDEQVNQAFYTFINMVLLVLRKLGVEAVSTQHNDVLIDGRKVSGTACYHLNGRNVVHATLLYDTQMEHMLQAITPTKEKLQSKGIASVRQRITLLKDYISLTEEELKTFIRQALCQGEYKLTSADVTAIEALEQSYLENEFIHAL